MLEGDPERLSTEYRSLRIPEISQLREPFHDLLEKLRERIKNGDYQLVIGDDASGRLPALLMHRVVRAVYRKSGRGELPLLFLAGSGGLQDSQRREKTEKLESFIRSCIEETPLRRVLIVTEVVQTGESLRPLCHVLQDLGLQYDIATVGIDPPDGTPERACARLAGSLGGEVVYGMKGEPSVYGEHRLAGVQKLPEDLFAHRCDEVDGFDTDNSRKGAREARAEIQSLSEELSEWFSR